MIEIAVACVALVPLVCAALIYLLPGKAAGGLAVLATAGALIGALAIAAQVQSEGPQTAFGSWVYVDSLSIVILVLISIVGVCAAMNSVPYVAHEIELGDLRPEDGRRYFALILVFMATMAAVPLLNNLGAMWVMIEATTVVSVLLVSISRSGTSLEAAWKYLVLGSVGIALALFGTMMTYYASTSILGESGDGLNWTHLQALAGQLDPRVMRLAFAFVLVGYGTKVGLAPMHAWLPDAHSQAPSPVSALLSGVLLNCALYAVLRFRVLTMLSTGESYTDSLMIGIGLFSIGLAVPFLMVQHDIKRMLGYSSVEHMGIIVLAVGIGGELTLYVAMLHLVAHSLTKSSLFLSAGSIVQAFNSRSMHRIRGVMALYPLTAAGLLLGALALAGLPPFAMFTSEYGLLAGAFASSRAVVGILGLLLVALATACLLYRTIQVSYREPRPGAVGQRSHGLSTLSMLLPLALLIWASVAPPHAFRAVLSDAVIVLQGQR